MKNRVFVITGAAGSGKTTVRDYLHDQYQMARVITHTTRPPTNRSLTITFWSPSTMPATIMVHLTKA